MNYQEFLNKGLLKKEDIGFDQINKVLERAYENLESAEILIKNDHEDGAFRFGYEAMLLAGRALIFSYGLRPRAIGSHKIVIDFTEIALGKDCKVLIQKFNRMRKKRNYLIYGVGLAVSGTEAENAIKTAKEFIRAIRKLIQEKNPQKRLV